jgi:DNA-binding transcriptional ArsR family regulator
VLDELFAALGDPTRRALFDRLLRNGPQTATALVADAGMTISRQAVVKHLQALVEAGLATATRTGREVHYAATPQRLAALLAWLTDSSARWDGRIERLVLRARKVSGTAASTARTRSER